MDRLKNITSHSETSEKMIEKHLCKRVRDLGGVCLKYSNPGMVGYPDRVAIMPGGSTIWVELKSRGRKPSLAQSVRIAEMERMGHRVHVCDSRTGVDCMLRSLGYEI